MRDDLVKEQERYLRNIKKLIELRKEAPEKVRSLATSLADAETLLFENSIASEEIFCEIDGEDFQGPYVETWPNDVHLLFLDSQKKLLDLSEVSLCLITIAIAAFHFSY